MVLAHFIQMVFNFTEVTCVGLGKRIRSTLTWQQENQTAAKECCPAHNQSQT